MSDYIVQCPEHKHAHIQKLASDIQNCASWLLIHDYYTIDEKKLVGAKTCKKHLLCPFCAVGRGARSIAKTLPKVEKILNENPHLIPVLLTLTVRNGEDLAERHRHLVGARKKLIHKRRNALQGLTDTEFSKIHGAIYSDEVTHSDAQGWHPHTHMIALVSDYLDQSKLSEEWAAITGDSFIVDIRRIQERRRDGQTVSLTEALGEVFKYAVKLSDMPREKIWSAYTVLRAKRLLGGFGSLHGVKMEESPLEDPLEGLPYIELLYRWTSGNYNLEKSTHRSASS